MDVNKENVSINIQTDIRQGKTEITTEIHPTKGLIQSESSNIKSLEKGISQMHVRSEHEKNIPFSDLSGIETFNESMQIYFRDAYNLSRIFSLTMAIHLRIFEIIMQCSTSNNSSVSVKDIRTKILTINSLSNLNERHLSDLLSELETQGFLESEGPYENRSFRLTDFSRKYLLINSPNSICRMYMNINRFMKSFEENMLSNFSLMGKPVNHSEYNFLDENETGMVLDYYYKTSERSFDRLIELVDFSRFKRVVDVRGSYGLLAAKLKKRFPTVEFISFDNPTLETFAVEKLTTLNMINDVVVKSGSILSGPIPESDCVIAPHIFMHFNNDNTLTAMNNIFRSLSPNGQLIILENLIDPESKDCKAITMSFMMGIKNCEGQARSFNEYMALLMSCGFRSCDRIQTGPGMSDLIIATK